MYALMYGTNVMSCEWTRGSFDEILAEMFSEKVQNHLLARGATHWEMVEVPTVAEVSMQNNMPLGHPKMMRIKAMQVGGF